MRFAIAALWLAGCGASGFTSAGLGLSPPEPPPGSATLAGIVTDRVSGSGIPGVTMFLGNTTTLTSTVGSYVLDGLLPGAVVVSTAKEGYAPSQFQVDLREGNNRRDVSLSPLIADLSGWVVSLCGSGSLDAKVRVGEVVVCADRGKGGFYLKGLSVGPALIVAGKEYYQTASRPIDLVPGTNVLSSAIQLEPVGGCGVVPQDVPCQL